MSEVLLTTVTACVECGMLQPSGFRGGTPIADPEDTERLKRKAEVYDIDIPTKEIPGHLDDRYNVWMSHQECPVCENHFYHRLSLPTEGAVEYVKGHDDTHGWGDL